MGTFSVVGAYLTKSVFRVGAYSGVGAKSIIYGILNLVFTQLYAVAIQL